MEVNAYCDRPKLSLVVAGSLAGSCDLLEIGKVRSIAGAAVSVVVDVGAFGIALVFGSAVWKMILSSSPSASPSSEDCGILKNGGWRITPMVMSSSAGLSPAVCSGMTNCRTSPSFSILTASVSGIS